MGWEDRKDYRYYYRKRRVGDRVVSEYVGTGPLAELVALNDENARLIAEWKRVGIGLFRSDYEAAEAAYDALSEAVDERCDLVLAALGYRKRKGEWRRCRAARPSSPADSSPTDLVATDLIAIDLVAIEPTSPHKPMSKERTAIRAALAKNAGLMESTLQEARLLKMNLETALERGEHEEYNAYLTRLREALRETPALWGRADEHVRQTAHAFLVTLAKNDPTQRSVALGALADLLDDLGYHACPPLERLLVERVALAWLACRATDWCHRALAFRTEPGAEGRESKEPEHGPYWERRAAAAERRLERAVESLARTRKLVRATKGVQREYASLSAEAHASASPAVSPAASPAASVPTSGTETPTTDAATTDEPAPADQATVDAVQGVLGAMAAEAAEEAAALQEAAHAHEEAPDDEEDGVCLLDAIDDWTDAGKDMLVFHRACWAGAEPWRDDFDPTPFEDPNFDPSRYYEEGDEPYEDPDYADYYAACYADYGLDDDASDAPEARS